ncbi:MAG: hypothetical protein EOO09_09710 [Chitinophagaceae bacterium]|nr:MAG: hypothetical protein EOO09_09710 [Chitinophagaceae bacterium]
MKKLLCSLCLLSLLSATFNSCKKSSDEEEEEPEECELSVASIAGTYKLVVAKRVEASGEIDVTNQLYDACELDDLNELKADGTFKYTDAGTSCGGPATFTGTWLVNGRVLKINSGFANIESFNCRDLVITYRDDAGNLIKETNRRQ